jgi:hypothetical protein
MRAGLNAYAVDLRQQLLHACDPRHGSQPARAYAVAAVRPLLRRDADAAG